MLEGIWKVKDFVEFLEILTEISKHLRDFYTSQRFMNMNESIRSRPSQHFDFTEISYNLLDFHRFLIFLKFIRKYLEIFENPLNLTETPVASKVVEMFQSFSFPLV